MVPIDIINMILLEYFYKGESHITMRGPLERASVRSSWKSSKYCKSVSFELYIYSNFKELEWVKLNNLRTD